jgi:hypothetical protein
MVKFKIGITYVLFSFLTIIYLACDYDVGFEESRKELENSKSELTTLASKFSNQNHLSSVLRRDYNFTTFGKFINIFKTIETEYFVIGKSLNNNTFTFKVEGDEEAFFSRSFDSIKSKGDNLKNFLESQGISLDLFKDSREFLYDKDFFQITSSSTDGAVLIYIGRLDGLLFSPKKGIETDNPRFEEIIPIEENWYYFRKEQ